MDFTRQLRGFYIVPHSSVFPQQPSWSLASILIQASPGREWEIGTTHLIGGFGREMGVGDSVPVDLPAPTIASEAKVLSIKKHIVVLVHLQPDNSA